jgi:CheY-like chemotaxis protein
LALAHVAASFDLILLGVTVPVLDGHEVLRRKAAVPLCHIPVIMLSALDEIGSAVH